MFTHFGALMNEENQKYQQEREDSFQRNWAVLTKVLQELESKYESKSLYISLFNIEAMINESALFRVKLQPLDVEFKLLTRQKFSQKYINIIKQLLNDKAYDDYNKHLWEYSQVMKLSYQINGEKARKIFGATIAHNPNQLKKLYKDSCLEANIPILKATINQQIQDACFKNKDKHLITCLYEQSAQPDIYISKIMRML